MSEIKERQKLRTKFENRPVRPPVRNLSGQVAELLGEEIVSGKHPVGSALPSDIDGSKKFAISRAAYREAIKILSAKGLVASRQKAGTKVTTHDKWNLLDPDVLAWMFSSEPSEDFVRDLFELRSIIEPAAASLAAQRRTVEHLSCMHQALTAMERYGLYTVEGRKADEDFHAHILAASGNQALISLTDSISAAIHWSVFFNAARNKKIRNSIPDHRNLYAAITQKDTEAAKMATLRLLTLALEDTKFSIKIRK